MLERALELDPHFAEARAWKAFTTFLILDGGYSNDVALLNEAEGELRRALQDDATLARAHTGFAAVYLMQGRRELMPAELDQALKANNNDEDALFFLMLYHQYAGEYVSAQHFAQRVLDRLPLFGPARMHVGYMLLQQGDLTEQVLKWGALVAYLTSEIAVFYALVGDAPKALDWLDRAASHGDERAEWFRRDPLLANIRDHPRFEQILQSIAYRRQQRKPLG